MGNYQLKNMEHFGLREIGMAADLMKAYVEGKAPRNFYDDGVTVEFNPHSGNVFLVNSDYQVLMLDDNGGLFEWYFLSYAGEEGSAEDLLFDFRSGNIERNDYEELADILEREGMDDEAAEVRAAIEATA